MRRNISVLLAVLIAVSAFAPAVAGQSSDGDESTVECEFPLEMTDATGETITLEEAPESVVALGASDAQTVFEIGAEGRLVGMPYSDATSGLDRGDRVDVGTGFQINHERVISLEPDIVLAANTTSDGDIDQLRSAGLTVYQFHEAQSLDDVKANVRNTGTLTGECDGAAETVDWMNEQLEIVERTLDGKEKPLAYYAMGEEGYTAGTETFQHEILTTAGVENVAGRAGITKWQPINPETVVNENPEWIIHPGSNADAMIPDTVESTTAYQNGNIVSVNANHISQPAPQVVYAIVDIVKTIHPDAYAEAESELEVSAGSGNESNDQPTDDGSNESAIPGFGVPAALVALLAAAGFVARRR